MWPDEQLQDCEIDNLDYVDVVIKVPMFPRTDYWGNHN
jgi:hypothetical protein